jgi:hypothetical protein
MTEKNRTQLGKESIRPSALRVEQRDGETVGHALARAALDPVVRHGALAGTFAAQVFDEDHRTTVADSTSVMGDEVEKAAMGDLTLASRVLAAQAISLDAMFTEMVRRSGNSMGVNPEGMQRYMRLALKAQSACRTTLEALAKLHLPREQTIKHVYVGEGGQAVIADQFHQHGGEEKNGKPGEQSDATGAAGRRAALPRPDTFGDAMPISCRERKAPVQNARRHKQRR